MEQPEKNTKMEKCNAIIYKWVWMLNGDQENPVCVNIHLKNKWFIDKDICIEDAKRIFHQEGHNVNLAIVSKNMITGFYTEEIIML